MIKKLLLLLLSATVYLNLVSPVSAQTIQPVENYFELRPVNCGFEEGRSCPSDLLPVYQSKGESCATSFEAFKSDPVTQHYWIEDPQITAQGKANDRARQFIYWVMNKNAIDDHPALRTIWGQTRNIAYFLVVLVAAVMGIGFIVGQRTNFQIDIKVWPSVGKIALALIYITFSAAIVLLLIQVSEVIMKFFIEKLGGRDLFTIYFTTSGGPQPGSELNYTSFFGCRDLNIRAQESVQAEVFLFKATNITYYVMGSMIILRKVLLWFMLFVSPFLAILFPFVFIRNIGWIWIGVFFQWLFYGPLFALFLGALATIWKSGIPFAFDFSRVNNIAGYVYPTAINIVYGGPAQRGEEKVISALNNGNYIDTFAEYVITLIMLWAVIFFPWWLLRIFRDYCCEGIVAMKNILLSWYDQSRGAPGKPPQGPSPVTAPSFLKQSIKMPKEVEVPVKVKLETIEDIKQTRTEDISRSLDLRVSKLTDVARFETDKTSRETVRKNLEYLSNPIKAETPAERQKYMNLRTELFNRAIRDDHVAKQILTATSTSAVEKIQRREEILSSTPTMTPITHVVSVKVKLPQDKVSSINNTLVNVINTSSQILSTIAQNAQITTQQVQQILNSYKSQVEKNSVTTSSSQTTQAQTSNQYQTANEIQSATSNIQNVENVQNVSQSQTTSNVTQQTPAAVSTKETATRIVENISKETGVATEKVVEVIKEVSQIMKTDKETAKDVTHTRSEVINNLAKQANIPVQEVQNILNAYQNQVVQNNLSTAEINAPAVAETVASGATASRIVENISRETNTSQETVTKVIREIAQVMQTDKEVEKDVTHTSGHIINNIAQKTQTTTQQVQQILNAYKTQNVQNNLTTSADRSQVLNQITSEQTVNQVQTAPGVPQTVKVAPAPGVSAPAVSKLDTTRIVETISKETGIQKEIVVKVIKQVAEVVKTNKEVAKEVAEKENIKTEQLEKIIETEIPAIAEPEKNVEQTINIPPSIPIEDYEEVKHMWTQQYEQGDVPTTENIATREEWVDHDIVTISNTVNKLVSPSPELRQQGLDEIGYILPIFLINNLKGDELLVYLKAKLEAAKAVKEGLNKEKETEEKTKKEAEKEEELVDAAQPKKEEKEKEMTLEDELKEPEKTQEASQTGEAAPAEDAKETTSNSTPLKGPTEDKK